MGVEVNDLGFRVEKKNMIFFVVGVWLFGWV